MTAHPQKEILLKTNIKITPGRQAILAVLKESGTPLDISEINERLQKNFVKIDIVTIYRAINKFVGTGLVKQIELREGKFRYELSDLPHHHHAVCTNCGNIQDIKDCDVAEIEGKVKQALKFKVKYHTSEFYGLCNQCSK